MPRRSILTVAERDGLLALPDAQDELIRYYSFNESDVALVRQRRGNANRLGFAVQLCLLRYPVMAWPSTPGRRRLCCAGSADNCESTPSAGRNMLIARRPDASTWSNCVPTWA